MHKIQKFTIALLAFLAVAFAPPASAASAEKRMALAIGNAAYQAGALATPANDAGLIAHTPQAAGIRIVATRNLEKGGLRPEVRDFAVSAPDARPEMVSSVQF